ncbi:MAG: ThiF family adenylyltransferase, partial [Bacteroidota bacterium]
MDRYTRQTSLPDFGLEGQRKLSNAKVLVVGLGGLGLPALQYLNAMGVGTLGLVDQDIVDFHNLQRQILYTEKDVGTPKLTTTLEKLKAQNANTILKAH